MNIDKIKDKLPVDSVIHVLADGGENILAVTIPAVREDKDGGLHKFDKLVAYQDQKRDWVHKDYRENPSKSKKKGKKRG